MKILLEAGVWLTEGEGDPPRTLNSDYAAEYKDIESALIALKEARKYRPFPNAELVEDFI